MDEQTERPEPLRAGMSELVKVPQGGQAASEGPAENPLAAKEPHRIPGRFLPGVMPPVGRQWKPGQSGNPAGYSNAGRLTKRLIAALEKDDGKLADALTMVILKKALTGDYKFVQELINRSDGLVTQRLAVTGAGPLVVMEVLAPGVAAPGVEQSLPMPNNSLDP